MIQWINNLTLDQEIGLKLSMSQKEDNIIVQTVTIRSSLCNYSDAYILVKGTITVPNTAAAGAAVNNTNKKVIFKNWAPFTLDNWNKKYTDRWCSKNWCCNAYL